MPVLPYAVALVALALARGRSTRAASCALALILAALERASSPRALWSDPHAANDCALLLAQERVRGRQRLRPEPLHPHLGGRRARPVGAPRWRGSCWPRRSRRGCAAPRDGRGGARPVAALFGLAATRARRRGLVLERWPSAPAERRASRTRSRSAPAPPRSSRARACDGARAWVDSRRAHDPSAHARRRTASLRVRAEGEGVGAGGRADRPWPSRAAAPTMDVTLEPGRRPPGPARRERDALAAAPRRSRPRSPSRCALSALRPRSGDAAVARVHERQQAVGGEAEGDDAAAASGRGPAGPARAARRPGRAPRCAFTSSGRAQQEPADDRRRSRRARTRPARPMRRDQHRARLASSRDRRRCFSKFAA